MFSAGLVVTSGAIGGIFHIGLKWDISRVTNLSPCLIVIIGPFFLTITPGLELNGVESLFSFLCFNSTLSPIFISTFIAFFFLSEYNLFFLRKASSRSLTYLSDLVGLNYGNLDRKSVVLG